jgi:hypothetical protein
VSGFSKVRVSGARTLIITQGSIPSLVVEGKRPVLHTLTTTVSGDTLLLQPHGVWYAPITYSDADRVTYHLTVTELTGIEAHGATRIESAQPLTVKDLALSTSGAAKLHARDLVTDQATIDCSGAAKVQVYVSEQLNVSLSGTGRVTYAGDPQVTQSISGAGKVERAE